MTFNKLIAFTDIHFGKRANSDTHNQDCLDFIDWMISVAKENEADTCIFLGDWHDVRASLNIKTMDYSIRGLEKLSENFKNVYIILGNHDLFHRYGMDIHSLRYGHHIKNVHIIDKPEVIGDIAFIPWIADNNYDILKNLTSRYVFSHLELPHFFMNAMIPMPDTGQANAEMFDGPDFVFSGHFHKRQTYRNSKGTEIIYIGNCFPHSYSDVGDADRGCMLLEHDKEPIFINWQNSPNYKIAELSKLIETPEEVINERSNVKVDNDMDLPHDEISFIKDTIQRHFKAREIIITPKKSDDILQNFQGQEVEFKSVDHIVLSHLDALDTEAFDKALLQKLYLEL